MPSLFFWRKKPSRAAAPPALTEAAPSGEAAAPAGDPGTTPAARPLVLQRLVYALALGDARAADLDVRPGPAQVQLMLEASAAIARVGCEPRYTPGRPSLLPQIMEMLDDEEASLKALSGMLSRDPQLTGDLLRTANSPFYRVGSQPVESVDRAASVLGTQGIRMLVAARLLRPLAGADSKLGRFGEVVWDHSLYSASAAEAWAGRSQDADPFTAHLLALLNGVGVATVYRVINDLYQERPELERNVPAIADSLHANSAVTAARIAASWGLSGRSCQALEAQSSAAPVGGPAGLARAVRFGLLAGAATSLCRYQLLAEEHAFHQIEAAGFTGPVAARVWDRLVQAYIRH